VKEEQAQEEQPQGRASPTLGSVPIQFFCQLCFFYYDKNLVVQNVLPVFAATRAMHSARCRRSWICGWLSMPALMLVLGGCGGRSLVAAAHAHSMPSATARARSGESTVMGTRTLTHAHPLTRLRGRMGMPYVLVLRGGHKEEDGYGEEEGGGGERGAMLGKRQRDGGGDEVGGASGDTNALKSSKLAMLLQRAAVSSQKSAFCAVECIRLYVWMRVCMCVMHLCMYACMHARM
jgi:hypothetical protein